jgi:hypothetical protein
MDRSGLAARTQPVLDARHSSFREAGDLTPIPFRTDRSLAESDRNGRGDDWTMAVLYMTGLASGDPDDRGDCAEHCDEKNYRGERAGANSRPLAR